MVKNILCYGDSLTWGYIANSFNFETFAMGRYPLQERWTGILQNKLGNNYKVIEEGLCGRTTNIEDPLMPPGTSANGKTFLANCLFTAAPLDLVILFLGMNDL